MPDWLVFILASFATFRLAELVAVDDGPGDVLLWMRARLGAYDLGEDGQPETSIGRMVICPYCLGIYFAGLLTLTLWPISILTPLYWLAIAGGQAFLQHVGGRV